MWSNKFVKGFLFLIVFLIFILNASGNIESIDGLASLTMAQNFVYHGTWEVSPPEYNVGMGSYEVDGKYYSFASKGYSVVMIPAVLITKYIYDKNGFTPISRFPLESDYLLTFFASFVNPILGFLLFVIMYMVLKFISKNEGLSFVLSVMMILTTNLFVLAKDSFVHILFLLLLLCAVYCEINLINNIKKIRWYILLAVDLVLIKLCYNTSFILPFIVVYIFFVLSFFLKYKLNNSRNYFILMAITLLLCMLGGLLVGINPSNFRTFLLGEGTRNDFVQGFWGLMFSPGRSVFVYSPLLILSLYLSVRNFQNSFSKLFVFVLSVYVFFYSLYDIWHGELSYGPRYISMIIPFGFLVLAVNWNNLNKYVFSFLCVFGLYVQLVGLVIPYQVQYSDYQFLGVTTDNIKNRQDQFDYWSLGEFIPRYSPPYRLKRVLVTRLFSLKDIFKNTNSDAILASNVMLPDKNSQGRGVESVFYVKVLKDVNFDKIDIGVDKKYKNLILCDKNGCQKNKYNFFLKKGDLLKFDFGTNEKYYITKLVLGENSVNLTDYRLVNTDRYLNRDNILGQEKNITDLKTDWWYTGMVNNLTPDFWWVKVQIYENVPVFYRNSSYFLFVLFGSGVLIVGIYQVKQLFFKPIKTKKIC